MEFTMGGVRGGCMVYHLSGFGSMGLCDILLEALVPTIKQKWAGCLFSRYSFLSLFFSFSQLRLL